MFSCWKRTIKKIFVSEENCKLSTKNLNGRDACSCFNIATSTYIMYQTILKREFVDKSVTEQFQVVTIRVATVRENYMENDFFSKSGKSQGISWMAREI